MSSTEAAICSQSSKKSNISPLTQMTISKPLSAGQARIYHNAAVHDAWLRAKVQEALDDPRPATPHEKVEAHFATRLAAWRKVR